MGLLRLTSLPVLSPPPSGVPSSFYSEEASVSNRHCTLLMPFECTLSRAITYYNYVHMFFFLSLRKKESNLHYHFSALPSIALNCAYWKVSTYLLNICAQSELMMVITRLH